MATTTVWVQLKVIALLVIFSMNFAIQSFPIENGFSVKFNPIFAKEELRPRKFGTLFAKNPQEFKPLEETRREEILDTILIPRKSKVPSGYSNQVGKLLYTAKYVYDTNSNNETIALATHLACMCNLNLPLVRQPLRDYKVLVATAPPNVHLGGDDMQTLIYVVFPEEGSGEQGVYNVPAVYFVNGKPGKPNANKKRSEDPVIIVDSKRTVTGLKSKEIEKYVSFKNKLKQRYQNV